MSLLDEWVQHPHNVRFRELCLEAERLGFTLRRVKGSHHHYAREDVPELLTLSPGPSGKAVPAQVRRLRSLARQYGLSGRGEGHDTPEVPR